MSRPLKKAETLDEVFRVVTPQPLEQADELKEFYVEAMNEVRGGQQIQRLMRELRRSATDDLPTKFCVLGHAGIGKSTEISHMLEKLGDLYQPLRLNAKADISPNKFSPDDVVLITMIELVQKTKEFGDFHDKILNNLLKWFDEESEFTKQVIGSDNQAAAGINTQGTLWHRLSGLLVKLQGSIQYKVEKTTEIERYRLERVRDLINLVNEVIHECQSLLNKKTGKKWLIIWENFDKLATGSENLNSLFIDHANVLSNINISMIFTLPVDFFYAVDSAKLPFLGESYLLTDTPVFDQQQQPYDAGRQALEKVLAARMNLDLLTADAQKLAIIASGGNLRDLLKLVRRAAETADIAGEKQINTEHMRESVSELRSYYQNRLGYGSEDKNPIEYKEKAALMKRIYQKEAEACIRGPILQALLGVHAVQEFNSKRWFGLHPLVVDILIKQKHLPDNAKGGTGYA